MFNLCEISRRLCIFEKKQFLMNKEFKIGLLGLVACVLLYLGFNFLKGSDFFSTSTYYYVVYNKVEGLQISNPVMLNGLTVGRIDNIGLLQKEGNKLLVTLQIRNDLKLDRSSQAILTDNGLLGGKIIALNVGKITKPLSTGDTLKGIINEGMLADLTKKADPVLKQVDSIMFNVNALMKTLAMAREDIGQTLGNFNDISGSIKAGLDRAQLEQIMGNINQLSASLLQMQKQFNPIVGKMDQFADKMNRMELEKAVNQANASLGNLNQVLEKVNRGDGTLGALANNDSLYRNLNNVSHNMDKLFIDLRENPKRYVNISVFGKKDKKENK